MMKKAFLVILGLGLGITAGIAATVTYTADNTSIFPNPERGFTEELGGETMLSDNNNHVIQPEASWFFSNDRNSYASLLVAIYYFGNYRTKALSDKILQGFDEDMQILRNKGYKCVLRFAYDWESCNDATKDQVLAHIAQLKPHLAANADVIYVIETGFVGRWGEWYYTKNFGSYCKDSDHPTQHLVSNRRDVIDAMLDACPSDRFLLVRYPMIKTDYLGDNTALTSAQAFSGTARARLGHHNDAFLNEWGNDGTYASDNKSDDPAVRQYIANETLYVPNGGETNVEDDDLAADVYDDAESEMSLYHWSFCGESYAPEVTNKWRSSSIFNNLNRKMGYRYQLTTATLPESATQGGTARFQLNIKNVGYAPLYNYRVAKIVLKNSNGTYSIDLASDPRRWLPNGEVTNIDETLTIPANVPAGTYQLYLAMPDTSKNLKNDARYAIRFANTDVWDATLGMNNLNAQITINAGGVTPNPELSVSSTSVAFGNVTVGTAATKTFTVTGSNLTNNVTISSNNGALSVSPASLTPTQAQSTATVTLTLTATAAGSGSATVTVASNGATSKNINGTWSATAQGGGGDPTPSGDFTIDGNFDDWSDLNGLAHAEVPSSTTHENLYDMRWYADEAYIYFYLEFSTDVEPIDIFLSTDDNASTGHNGWMFQNSAAEYLIEEEDIANHFTDVTSTFFTFDGTKAQSAWDGWIEANISGTTNACAPVTLANGHRAIEGRIVQALFPDPVVALKVGVFTSDASWVENGYLPQGDGGDAAPLLEVPIYKVPTGIDTAENQDSKVESRKMIRNGQLFIIRDGKTYNAQGIEVR